MNLKYFSLSIIFFCSREVKQGYRPSMTSFSILQPVAHGREVKENQDNGGQ